MKKTLDIRGTSWRGPALVALVLAALLPACDDTVTNTPGTGRSVILVTVEPNPVIGTQNALTGSVSAAYVVRIREVGGTGGTINFVTSTVFEPESGVQVAVNFFDSADLKVFVGTDRIEAEGELEVTQTTNYTLPDFRVPANMTVNVQVQGDRGLVVNQSTLVPIVPAE
jgi:hypothetical protein